jgi:serine/threonine protein kinase
LPAPVPACTRQVAALFEAERQALAILDHPNIAKVFGGGVTPSGRPYFVMEYLKGVPITQLCDRNHFTPRQQLELFVQVCAAVQHAHQKGVILQGADRDEQRKRYSWG